MSEGVVCVESQHNQAMNGSLVDIEVPLLADTPLGPIHSLVHDHSGRIFLSDEINHRIVCLTQKGTPLWWRGRTSSDPIPFRYPQGIALGRMHTGNSESVDCLAVCDSWNDRVVFVSPEGDQIGEWGSAGDLPLKEVSDIRYLRNGWKKETEDEENCWLLVDRGNHRLCWLGEDGRLLEQVGKECIPWVRNHFSLSITEELVKELDSPKPKPVAPFNFMYYPSRLVGGTGQTMAVIEPFNNALKLIHHGFLVTLPLNCRLFFWLGFAECGFLGWDKIHHVLVLQDLRGNEIERIQTMGVPICADLEKSEWWEQQGCRITRHVFVPPAATSANESRNAEIEVSVASQLATMGIASVDLTEIEAAVNGYSECLHDLLRFAAVVCLRMEGSDLTEANPPLCEAALEEALNRLTPQKDRIEGKLRALCMPVLSWCISSLGASEKISNTDLLRFGSFLMQVQASLDSAFVALTTHLDRIVLAGVDFGSSIGKQGESAQNLMNLRFRIDQELWPIGKFLSDTSDFCARCRWFLGFEASDRLLPEKADSCQASDICGLLFVPGVTKTKGFKEIGRWEIGLNGGLHKSPRHLVLSHKGTIQVAFSSSSSILEVDRNGNTLGHSMPPLPGAEISGPDGIEWDDDGRLWMTYRSSKSVVVWDASKNTIQTIQGRVNDANGFGDPFAICKGRAGEMIVCDCTGHKINGITYEGESKYLAGSRGRDRGKFVHPCGLVRASEPGSQDDFAVWVVDHRNHRLQKLSPSGDVLGVIGGCGLRKGNMAFPLGAAVFQDGAIAIGMWHFIRCLMLVSERGEELGRIPIDFVPDQMLAIDNRLLVADYEGNRIRVYERQ